MAKMLPLEEPCGFDPPCETCGERLEECNGHVNTGDSRDFTPAPPAMLDPWWVLKMRRLVRKFSETGIINWKEWKEAA